MLKMDGQAVFKLAVGVLEDTARAVLAKAGRTEADIDWLIPHQANIRIMASTARKLKLPMDKVVVTVDQHGNTSAASIPLALDCAVRQGQERRIVIVKVGEERHDGRGFGSRLRGTLGEVQVNRSQRYGVRVRTL